MERVNTFSPLDDVNMPYSLEAGQAVLGSVLIDPSCITQVLILVKPEYFYLPQHKEIFLIMQEPESYCLRCIRNMVLGQMLRQSLEMNLDIRME